MKKKVIFDKAVSIGGQKYTEVEVREPLVSDSEAVDELADSIEVETGVRLSPFGREIELVAVLTGLNSDDLRKLKSSDYAKIQNEYAGFFSQAGKS